MEVVELVIGFVRIGTVIIRIRRTNVGSRDDVVTKAVQEHGSPASGDTLPPRTTKFVPEHLMRVCGFLMGI